jgi:hypothetical protein
MGHVNGGGLIDLIDIRAFFAIHFDVHEEVVHRRPDFGIGEALVVHHMAPMTGGVSDGEQDRLVLLLRLRQRGRTPWAPMHGIVLVQQQIGACFLGQQILGHGLFLYGPEMAAVAGRGAWF